MGQIKNIKLHIVTDIKRTRINLGAVSANMSEQTERAFQKQAPIFQNKKRVVGKAVKAKDQRFVKNVGLGFKTPREASEGTYIDKKCPFTGNVKSMKMNRTIVLRRDYLHFIKKYQRYEKRH